MARQDWLDAGLEILEIDGAPAVTIDRLCVKLELSKGSFYHHFRGIGDYRTALLGHFETMYTTRFIEVIEKEVDASSAEKLHRLIALVSDTKNGPELEIAIRAWASQDPEAYAVQERVDRSRTKYLEKLCRGAGHRPADAARLAQILYLLLIGAGHVVPPVPQRELKRLYDMALRLVTSENDALRGGRQ